MVMLLYLGREGLNLECERCRFGREHRILQGGERMHIVH